MDQTGAQPAQGRLKINKGEGKSKSFFVHKWDNGLKQKGSRYTEALSTTESRCSPPGDTLAGC